MAAEAAVRCSCVHGGARGLPSSRSQYLTLGSFGLVGPNTQAAAMNVDPARAGSISSIVGASTFGVGTVISTVSGYLHDGTPRPLALLILPMIVASSVALYGLAKPLAVQRPA
jgi:DHA1 family bicyclomycin/chloramphenicol resistance-like MFS transporter